MAREIIPLKRLCKTDDVVNLCNFFSAVKSRHTLLDKIFF